MGGKGSGRKPLPVEVKALKQTLRKHRLNNEAPTFPKVLSSDPPPGLEGFAAIAWKEYVGEMIGAGYVQTIDIPNLMILCNEVATYWELDILIKKFLKPKVKYGKNIAIPPDFYRIKKARDNAFSNFTKLAALYGMDPASRQAIKVAPPPPKDIFEDDD